MSQLFADIQQHDIRMSVTNTKFVLLVLVFNFWMSVLPTHPPTTVKRKLTYITTNATWKDAQTACSNFLNGSLVKESSDAVTNMIMLYQQEDWQQSWDNNVWTGMFVSDIGDVPIYKWTSDCSEHNPYIFHRFTDIPLSDDLEADKRCVYEYSNLREWVFDGCDSDEHSSVCEENLGPCTYERDVITGACTKGIIHSAAVRISSRQKCEDYCTTIKPLTIGNGQCWSVTYVATSGFCFPAVDYKPYAFDMNSYGYRAPCTDPAVIIEGNDSIVSWKRCFEKPSVFTEPISTSLPSASYDPNDKCPIIPTSLSFETTQMAETTSGLETTQTAAVATAAECKCVCTINATLTLEFKIDKLKKDTSVNKRETSAHYRTLSSASDNRTSTRVVGMSLGMGMIVGMILIISFGDIVIFCKFVMCFARKK